MVVRNSSKLLQTIDSPTKPSSTMESSRGGGEMSHTRILGSSPGTHVESGRLTNVIEIAK